MEIKRVNIKGSQIGLVGLDEIFQELKERQIADEEALKRALLKMVKDSNYVPSSAEEHYADALYREYRLFMGEKVEDEGAGLMIRILGQGCPRCDQIEQDIIAVLQELNLSADVEHVRDVKEISKYGIVATPALVINKKIKSTGNIPSKTQIKKWIKEEMQRS